MDEKHSEKNHRGEWKRQPPLTNNRIAIAFVLACFLFVSSVRTIYASPISESTVFKYDGEDITWEPCGDLKGHSLECSSIDVPMDQFNRSNPRDKNFTIPIIRLRGSNATRNLFLNPGGPGGSGIELIFCLGEQLKTVVGEGFHLLSFDPRGVNSSTPMASCYPDATTRRDFSDVRSYDVIGDSPELYAWTQNFVKACQDTMGEYGKYLNTPQTAADMNSILDALGQKDMFYWGFSYGSLLGQTYAEMFPERSKRVIIDGVVDQLEWYGGLFEEESQVDADTVLEGFFDECIKAGEQKCSLCSLATSKQELREIVLSSMEDLRRQPVSVYINNNVYGVLDHHKVWYNGVFPALYKPQTWTSLADNLYNLIQGNATDAFLVYGGEKKSDESWEFVVLNDGLSGPDHWPQDRETLLDKILPLMNISLFGPSQNKIFYTRQQWKVPKTHTYVPSKKVKTAHPLLILSTTYDPVCPLRAARSVNKAFEGSQIVEVKGYGHCSLAVGSVCGAQYAREFLYEGKLPTGYTRCPVDSPYFVRAGDGSKVSQRRFEDPEERAIYLAQLEIARKWDAKGLQPH